MLWNRYDDGLKQIGTLSREAAAIALRKYGGALLAALPVETTAQLMELCLRDPSNPEGGFVANLADFTHLYNER